MDLVLRTRMALNSTVARRPLVRFRHRGLTRRDVMLAAYPKSGSTWLRFLIAQLATGDDLGFAEMKALIPITGDQPGAPAVLPQGGRLVKTHEAYHRVYHRAVYLVRDVRDVALSYYYHALRQGTYEGSLDAFLPRFLEGKLDGYRAWDVHVASWLDSPLQERGDLAVVRYEDLKADPAATLKRAADFLGLPAAPSALETAVQRSALDVLKAKEQATDVLKVQRTDIPVVRKGGSGGWRAVFTDAQQAAFAARLGPTLERLGYPL